MSIEYEVKLPGDLSALVEALAAIGAESASRRILEDDLVLDTPHRRLRAAGELLRLRHRGDGFLLTFKGPANPEQTVKARAEVQTPVDDGIAMLALLRRLGFEPVLRYQKYRTWYRCEAGNCRDLVLSLDETPIGNFLEVEGEPDKIHRCAELLGFDRAAYETRSYLRIHRERGGTGDMVFEQLDRKEWGE